MEPDTIMQLSIEEGWDGEPLYEISCDAEDVRDFYYALCEYKQNLEGTLAIAQTRSDPDTPAYDPDFDPDEDYRFLKPLIARIERKRTRIAQEWGQELGLSEVV